MIQTSEQFPHTRCLFNRVVILYQQSLSTAIAFSTCLSYACLQFNITIITIWCLHHQTCWQNSWPQTDKSCSNLPAYFNVYFSLIPFQDRLACLAGLVYQMIKKTTRTINHVMSFITISVTMMFVVILQQNILHVLFCFPFLRKL